MKNSTLEEQVNAIHFALDNLKAYGFRDSMTESHLRDAMKTLQWNIYYERLKAFHDYCEDKRPVRSDFDSEFEFKKATSQWNMMRSCDAPNKPGYEYANND